ncbi:MAG: PEP-CTERM sorting domain-containing protein [Verrucomicrobiota bacterium]
MKHVPSLLSAVVIALAVPTAPAALVTFEATGADPASITPARDAFRAAVGGGTVAGANGSFGGLRHEINWDGLPADKSDPNLFPADFFNTTSPRGVVFSTPGTGFLVSANAGGPVNPLFGFPSDFQAFSPQKLFTPINSNVTDVSFFLPGTTTPATTSAFGLIFTDVETAGITKLEFFDPSDTLIYSRDALVSGNQGLSFLGALADAGEQISRVRITSGLNTIVSNGILGNPNDDVVVMDDLIYATPVAVPEPATALFGLALIGFITAGRRRNLRTCEDAQGGC